MENNKDNKRRIAKKIHVNDLLKGTYIKRPGWEPSGVLTRFGEITRVNIFGLVVSLSENTFLLDDGTSNITVRSFEPLVFQPEIGDLVNVVGRVRENNNTFFLVPEIIKKTNRKWHTVHNLEIRLQKKTTQKLPVETTSIDMETGPSQKILNVIAILDKGSGVDVDEIVSNVKINNGETIIKSLIEEGEIFELSPGKVKLLE